MTTTLALAFVQTDWAWWDGFARHARLFLHHAAALSPLPDASEEGTTYVVTLDGGSGYALTAGGDLQQVFSNVRGRGDAIVSDAVARGARTLDCFDGYLPTLYARHGFHETRREANWTVGGPDVVYMVHA